MTGEIKAVLFDKDGTLVDFQATWWPWSVEAAHLVADETGHAVEEIARSFGLDLAGARFEPHSPLIAGTPEEVVPVLATYYPDLEPKEIIARVTPPEGVVVPVPVEGLERCLDGLRAAGIRLGVVTNDFAAQTEVQLAEMGIASAFDVVIGYDSGHGAKPAPDGCLAAARALGARPEDTVMVGDTLHDLHAARAAGMVSVGVLTGIAGRENLTPHADTVMPSIAGLPAWLVL
ncbi:HAD family hydrolase [Celeribacter sp.]|uniref:HAD family hydrolase n=1 Tax=Celeribacter sp. TaxID=1890673 RepID=UPI003A946D29